MGDGERERSSAGAALEEQRRERGRRGAVVTAAQLTEAAVASLSCGHPRTGLDVASERESGENGGLELGSRAPARREAAVRSSPIAEDAQMLSVEFRAHRRNGAGSYGCRSAGPAARERADGLGQV